MKNGFTLIELMIVVAIIGILVAVMIPISQAMFNEMRGGCTKITIFQDGKAVKEIYRRGVAYTNNGSCVNIHGESFCGTLSVEKLESCPQMSERE